MAFVVTLTAPNKESSNVKSVFKLRDRISNSLAIQNKVSFKVKLVCRSRDRISNS